MNSEPPSVTPPLSADEHGRLDRSLIKGVAWTGASKWIIQIFTWMTTLVAVRLLTPNDYGLMAMVGVWSGLIMLVSGFSFDSAIVMLSDLSEDQVAQVNTLSIMFGIAGFLASCLAAIPLGWFFDTPALPNVVIVMGLGCIINSFQVVPSALLQKEHRFKALSVIGAIRAMAQASAVLVFALLGFQYWSLALGALLSFVLGVVLTFLVRRHRLAIPRFSSLTHALSFSWRVLVTRLSWFVYSGVDSVIAGRMLGQAALGSYNVAWDLATAPLEKVTSLICSVTPAFYSAVKEDPRALRRYLLRPIEVIAMVIFPAMVGMSLVASDLVLTLFGTKWETSIPVLQLLPLYGCVRSIVPLFQQVLIATEEEKFVMWNGIITTIVLTMAFFFGSQWGIPGIAAAWIIASPINAVPFYRKVCRKIGLTHSEFLRALLPAITGSALMSMVVITVKLILDGHLLPAVAWIIVQVTPWELPYLTKIAQMLQWLLDGHFGNAVRLVVQVVSGAVAYILAIWNLHPERVKAFRYGLAISCQ